MSFLRQTFQNGRLKLILEEVKGCFEEVFFVWLLNDKLDGDLGPESFALLATEAESGLMSIVSGLGGLLDLDWNGEHKGRILGCCKINWHNDFLKKITSGVGELTLERSSCFLLPVHDVLDLDMSEHSFTWSRLQGLFWSRNDHGLVHLLALLLWLEARH